MGNGLIGTGEFDPFIGRDAELATVLHESDRARLVTLTGPGGIGKTRLAEAAVAVAHSAGRDAWFVDLSTVSELDLVGGAIVSSLRIDAPGGGSPLDAIARVIGEQPSTLVLDNVEQIVGIGRLAIELLAKAPSARIIATSRVPLQVRGEVEVQIPPLGLPTAATVEAVESSPAGQLFLVRSRALGRLRTLDTETARALAALLHRLDGIPLAIELAAARTRALTPEEILHRLEEHGPAAIDARDPHRHRSLATILEWTLSLLPPADRTVLRAISVCAGFDFALAQSMNGDTDAAPVLEELVALGLVMRVGSASGSTRFKLLETIRHAVYVGLDEHERPAFQARLAEHMQSVAEAWYRQGEMGTDAAIVEAFDADADNVRRVLDWLAISSATNALDMWFHLQDFWLSRARLAEGLERFDQLAKRAPEPTAQLARAAAAAAALPGSESSNLADARTQMAWELATAVRDPSALVLALYARILSAFHTFDRKAGAEAAGILDSIDAESIGLSMQAKLAEARVFGVGATAGHASDEYVAAQTELMSLQKGRPVLAAYTAGNLAQTRLARGEFKEAARLAGDAVVVFRAAGRPTDVAWMLSYRAAALAESGQVGAAIEAASEGVALRIEMGDLEYLSDCLITAMPVAIAAGQALFAARCWGAVLVQNEVGKELISGPDRKLGERWLKKAVAASTELAVQVALRDGRAVDAVELLRSFQDDLRAWTPTAGADTPTRLRHGELSKREIEILGLVGAGRSDVDIGEELFISPKTASVHVSNVKAKLGVKSRLELALRAKEMGLS